MKAKIAGAILVVAVVIALGSITSAISDNGSDSSAEATTEAEEESPAAVITTRVAKASTTPVTGPSESSAQSKKDTSDQKAAASESKAATPNPGAIDPDLEKVNATYHEYVNNDTTHRWRIVTFYADDDGEEYVVPLYNEYKKADDEVFFIINLSKGVEYVVNNIGDPLITVSTHDYINGEENDAVALGSGKLLADDQIYNTSTGDVVDISSLAPDDTESEN